MPVLLALLSWEGGACIGLSALGYGGFRFLDNTSKGIKDNIIPVACIAGATVVAFAVLTRKKS